MTRSILSGTIALALLSTAAFAADSSEAARLKKLEDAVAHLQQENAALKSEIQAQKGTDADFASSAAAKIKMSDSVSQLKLYGDFMLRYYINEGVAAGLDSGDTGLRGRLRYRLHLNADFQLTDNWMFGVRLEPNTGRAAVVTLGENPVFAKATVSTTGVLSGLSTTNSSFLNGATLKGGKLTTTSGKSITTVKATKTNVVSNYNVGDTVFVGRAFLRNQPTDWLTITGGKMPNPFVTTRMVWDPDISPEGFSEQFKVTLGGSGSAGPDGKESKDIKAVVPQGMTVDLFANFGQLIYNDVGFENSFNTGTGPFDTVPNAHDRWMLGWQLGAKANFNKDTYFQIAPAFYHYSGGGTSSAGPFNGDNAIVILDDKADPKLITFNQTGTNDLAVIDIPVEFGWKMFGKHFSIFGDFAHNLDAATRAAKAGHPDTTQGTAWQIGASVGETKKKGDWELRGWYQRSEQFALDQNIIDDDIFDGRLNMQGWYIQGTYMLTDAASIGIQYSHGSRIDPNLGTAGFGLLGTPAGFPLQSTNLLYVDVTLKF